MKGNFDQQKSFRCVDVMNSEGTIYAEVRQKISPVTFNVERATVYLFYSGVMSPAEAREVAEILTEAARICDEWNASVGIPDFIPWAKG